MNQPALFKGLHPTIRQVRQQDAQRKAQGPLTPKQLELAAQTHWRAWRGHCEHEPTCGSRDACIEKIARHQRRMGWS